MSRAGGDPTKGLALQPSRPCTQLRPHRLNLTLVRCITHRPQSGLTLLRMFQSLDVPLFWQHLDIERAASPQPVQEGHSRFLSQTNKEMQLGQARGRLVTAGPQGVLAGGQEWLS